MCWTQIPAESPQGIARGAVPLQLVTSREPERERAIGHEREPILAHLACRLVGSKANVNFDNVGSVNGTTSRPCAICAKAPTGHRRGLAIPSPKFEEGYAWGTGS